MTELHSARAISGSKAQGASLRRVIKSAPSLSSQERLR